MRAHLAGKDRIFFSHAILDESVATLCDDGLRTMLLADFHRRPDHAWIKNDLVPAAVLGQQNVREHRRYVRARDELTFLIEEHAAVGVSVPDSGEIKFRFAHQLFRLGTICRLHRIGRSLRE